MSSHMNNRDKQDSCKYSSVAVRTILLPIRRARSRSSDLMSFRNIRSSELLSLGTQLRRGITSLFDSDAGTYSSTYAFATIAKIPISCDVCAHHGISHWTPSVFDTREIDCLPNRCPLGTSHLQEDTLFLCIRHRHAGPTLRYHDDDEPSGT